MVSEGYLATLANSSLMPCAFVWKWTLSRNDVSR